MFTQPGLDVGARSHDLEALLPGVRQRCPHQGVARSPSPPSWAPPTEAAIGEAALAAVAAAPWDSDPSGWGILCTPQAPCDTLVVEPRVVALPTQVPTFFVPDRRQVAATLNSYALSLSHVPGRQTILGSWRGWTPGRGPSRLPPARETRLGPPSP